MFDPLKCAFLVIGCFFVTGIFQTLFLKSKFSESFAQSVDFGLHLGSQRLFGENKTFRGFVIMLPMVTLCFTLFGLWYTQSDSSFKEGFWALELLGWTKLGFFSALGYTLGELPNSFIKRRLGIPPGEQATQPLMGKLFFIVDQLDSIVCALLVIGWIVPTNLTFWVACLLIGAIAHYGFNVVLYWLGIKKRAA